MKILLEYNEMLSQLSANEVQEILATISSSEKESKKGKKQAIGKTVLMGTGTFAMMYRHQRLERIEGGRFSIFSSF